MDKVGYEMVFLETVLYAGDKGLKIYDIVRISVITVDHAGLAVSFQRHVTIVFKLTPTVSDKLYRLVLVRPKDIFGHYTYTIYVINNIQVYEIHRGRTIFVIIEDYMRSYIN